jgi:putative membrane protein
VILDEHAIVEASLRGATMNTIRKLSSIAVALLLSHAAIAADLKKDDADYLKKTAQGLMAEVEMGKMAEKQASDERVKQFGKRMIDDHGKDLQNIKQLAGRKNLALPDSPDKDQRKEADKLAKMSGTDFDKEYVKYEAKDHKEDVEESGKTMKKTKDADVKAFATASYQTVSQHKKIADDLQAQLGK